LLAVACGLFVPVSLAAAAAAAMVPAVASADGNPLGYSPAPSDGDPLQHVRWYVFGAHSPAGQAARQYQRSNPSWAADLDVIADTPGSLNYRFTMWRTPAEAIAQFVGNYLREAEREQPGTTVQLSTYSLVHGSCLDPASIRGQYEHWITQLAKGIGSHRVVLHLEQDSLLETHCLTTAQVRVREQELAYAVRALSGDPHLLVYLDGGAPDGGHTPRQMAALLRASDVAQAAGFDINATHEAWTTTSIHYGQQVASMIGGKHFIVNTSTNGRGPLLNPHPRTEGVEQLCNPPGRGLGPMTVNTGYKYVDALLWFNNPGNSVGPCGAGDPPGGTFWPQYAVGLVENRTDAITGPPEPLTRSSTDS
jgi:endoglucanase